MEEEDISMYKESYNVPMSKLSSSTLKWLSHQLNVPRSTLSPNNRLLQDWRGLAEMFGSSIIDIENIQLLKDPCYEMLTRYAGRQQSSIYELLNALQKIERFDIIADEDFYQKIGKDCEKGSDIIQVPQIGCSIEVNPVQEEKTYTAFVCHHQDDLPFVRILAEELEEKNNFTLFIPERDQILGEYSINDLAKLIRTRCEKMLVILSPRFLKSSDCNFQISFAMAIDKTNKERKIIPIIYEACETPDILAILSKVDYTRESIRDWFWKRLVASLTPQIKHPQNNNSITSQDSAIGSSILSINESSPSTSESKSDSFTFRNRSTNDSVSSKKSFLNYFNIKKSKDETK